MALKDVDIESGMRRLADRRIEEAIREGKFDNLKGAGEPLDLEPMPADENARMTWWALKILRNNDFIPEEVRWRKQIDNLKAELGKATAESRVAALVHAVNALVDKLNTLGTNALQSPVAPLSLDVQLQKLRDRLTAPPPFATVVRLPDPPPVAARRCAKKGCETSNPVSAQFCRRCGASMV
ncbi:MAG: DnaJ-like, subfamily protein [Phycisphaerales bacterium]|nr:DnaJ-like, subfamily protein [Phycisphaerales bacterium]